MDEKANPMEEAQAAFEQAVAAKAKLKNTHGEQIVAAQEAKPGDGRGHQGGRGRVEKRDQAEQGPGDHRGDGEGRAGQPVREEGRWSG